MRREEFREAEQMIECSARGLLCLGMRVWDGRRVVAVQTPDRDEAVAIRKKRITCQHEKLYSQAPMNGTKLTRCERRPSLARAPCDGPRIASRRSSRARCSPSDR